MHEDACEGSAAQARSEAKCYIRKMRKVFVKCGETAQKTSQVVHLLIVRGSSFPAVCPETILHEATGTKPVKRESMIHVSIIGSKGSAYEHRIESCSKAECL